MPDFIRPVVYRIGAADADRRCIRCWRQHTEPTSQKGPARGIFLLFRAINRCVILPGAEVKEASAWTEGRRVPVCPALIARIGWHAIWLRRDNRPAVFIQATGPVHPHIGLGDQTLTGSPVEDVEIAVTVRPHHHLLGHSVPIQIREYRHLHGVIVVGVIRRELKIPFQFARIDIQRDNRIRVKIVTGALFVVPVRPGIADSPVNLILLRIK